MERVFGCPSFDGAGEMILSTCENEYRHVEMDVRVYRMTAGEERHFWREQEETAFLLLRGAVTYAWEGKKACAEREDVFRADPWCLHVCRGTEVCVRAEAESEILVQCAKNKRKFCPRLHGPKDISWHDTGVGECKNAAVRQVNTIFDHDICPESGMVLGEVRNDGGNWSAYPPHSHPQPEEYFFKFDRPEGFGASFVGERVFKSTDNSFAAIPGGAFHPQAAAPGFQMYTCWMIRHLEGNPWLQTDRREDPKYTWIHTT